MNLRLETSENSCYLSNCRELIENWLLGTAKPGLPTTPITRRRDVLTCVGATHRSDFPLLRLNIGWTNFSDLENRPTEGGENDLRSFKIILMAPTTWPLRRQLAVAVAHNVGVSFARYGPV